MAINEDIETKRSEVSGCSIKFIKTPPKTEPVRPPIENDAWCIGMKRLPVSFS